MILDQDWIYHSGVVECEVRQDEFPCKEDEKGGKRWQHQMEVQILISTNIEYCAFFALKFNVDKEFSIVKSWHS